MALPEVPPSTAIGEADQRRSARGGAFSMFVDSFDVYLPALVLPAAMAYFMPPDLPASVRATFTTLLFTVGLVGRPIGSVIFGNLSDRIGRKPVTMISGWGFTIVTLLIGLLPGYGSWGYGAIAVFAALRLIGGIFLAGGYAAPIPLALEQAPLGRRGRVGGLIGVGAPASFLVINTLLLGMLDVLPHSGFLSWGWRIPFFLGFALGVAYLMHYRHVVEDDSARTARQGARQPVVELFTAHRALIFSVFLFTCGYWFATQMSVSFLPTLLVQVLDQSPRLSSAVEIIGSVCSIVLIMVLAAAGQRFGRRALLMRWALVLAFVVGGAFALLVVAARAGAPVWLIALIAVVAKVLPSAPLGVILVYLNERFPASVRASGYGIGYMFGLILPGLYTVWLLALSAIMPYEFTPIVLIVFGGLLMFAAVRRGPETNPVGQHAPVVASEVVR
ncbi:MFS transporter [Amycolatopsis thermoflava]|uniref:Putative MFS family arabinose efflux permease n=1 Tax=Amycolatopsis thermoflava TaxID=84480 RepID=A0A3N2H8C5_9PSEU|nr:MFS transporter [Amycolatopsis thermoflava]ROS44600.1 putative MFS family arabinose efflux permease [Amycolatopsis thermoflava]